MLFFWSPSNPHQPSKLEQVSVDTPFCRYTHFTSSKFQFKVIHLIAVAWLYSQGYLVPTWSTVVRDVDQQLTCSLSREVVGRPKYESKVMLRLITSRRVLIPTQVVQKVVGSAFAWRWRWTFLLEIATIASNSNYSNSKTPG